MSGSILSAITQFLTPEVIDKMANASGLDRTTAQKAVGAAVPSMLSALASLASKPEGARQLSDALAQQPPKMLEHLANMNGSTARLADGGTSILASLLGGGGLSALTNAIGRFVGASDGATRSLLGLVAPAVLGVLGRTQRETGAGAAGLSQMLNEQKDQFAAAIPSGLSKLLDTSGFSDRLRPAAAAAASRFNEVQDSVSRTTSDVTRSSPSYSWAYWLVPLLALLGIGGYHLADRGSQVADTTRATTSQGIAPAKLVVDGTDVGRQTTATMEQLRASLQNISDAASAKDAVPKLEQAGNELDRLTRLINQLPPDGRQAFANLFGAANGRINSAIERVAAIPGVAPVLQPAIDQMRNKLHTIATAAGPAIAASEIAFIAKAPGEWAALSTYFSRDVHNSAGERLGTLNDLLIGPDGKVSAAVIGVGGFLGIGEKEVAVPFSSLKAARRDNTLSITVDATKDGLQKAPAYEWVGERARFYAPKQQ